MIAQVGQGPEPGAAAFGYLPGTLCCYLTKAGRWGGQGAGSWAQAVAREGPVGAGSQGKGSCVALCHLQGLLSQQSVRRSGTTT